MQFNIHRKLNPSSPPLPTGRQALQKGVPCFAGFGKEGLGEIFGRIFLLNYGTTTAALILANNSDGSDPAGAGPLDLDREAADHESMGPSDG